MIEVMAWWAGFTSAYLDNHQPCIARAVWTSAMEAGIAFGRGNAAYYKAVKG